MNILHERKKPYIILNVFKRKGGEGLFTKIVTDSNQHQFKDLLTYLVDGEKQLIVHRRREPDWVMLTNFRLIFNAGNVLTAIAHSDIKEIDFALLEEAKRGIRDKNQFSLLKITANGQQYVIEIEAGKPFFGFMNALMFVRL